MLLKTIGGVLVAFLVPLIRFVLPGPLLERQSARRPLAPGPSVGAATQIPFSQLDDTVELINCVIEMRIDAQTLAAI